MPSEKSTASARPAAYASVIRVGRIATSAISPKCDRYDAGIQAQLGAAGAPSAVQPVGFRHAKVARWDRAVSAHFLDAAETDARARLAVRSGVHPRGYGEQRGAGGKCDDAAEGAASHRDGLDGRDRRENHREEQAVVDARRQLQGHEQARQESVAQRAGVERPLHGPEGPGHPHRPLQLHVHEVREPVGREGEDQAGDDRGGRVAPEVAGRARTCRCPRRR